MKRKAWVWCGGLTAVVAACAGHADAAMLQLQGELTITNRTDELDPTNRFYRLPGGLELSLSVWGDPGPLDDRLLLGETVLAEAFWPDPGQSHTGSIAIDFLTPASGVIAEPPLTVDGLELAITLVSPRLFGSTLIAAGAAPQLGETVLFDVRSDTGARGDLVGSGAIRVDAIVPEPTTIVSLSVFGLALLVRSPRRGA